jgi:hypothetical protein
MKALQFSVTLPRTFFWIFPLIFCYNSSTLTLRSIKSWNYSLNQLREEDFMSRITVFPSVVPSLLTVLIIILASGCSLFSAPNDAEVLKAIEDSGILKSDSFSVTGPPVIVNKGSRDKEGYWPVRVKLTMIMQRPDGSKTEPKETTTTFRIRKVKDASGKSVWKAIL